MEEKEVIKAVDNEYLRAQQSANTLFKFMEKEEYLIKILKNSAIIPRYNIEIIDYLKLSLVEEIAIPMICFCDININKILSHTIRYGKYGIGLKKEILYKNKDIEPIHYVNPSSSEMNDLKEAFKSALNSSEDGENIQILQNYLLTSMIFKKPVVGDMYIKDKEKEKERLCFHDEREWRYIPKIDSTKMNQILWGRNLTKEYMEKCNKTLERYQKYWLKITPSDINYIIVDTEEDAVEMAKLIKKECNNYAEDEILNLISKIIILNNLGKDW